MATIKNRLSFSLYALSFLTIAAFSATLLIPKRDANKSSLVRKDSPVSLPPLATRLFPADSAEASAYHVLRNATPSWPVTGPVMSHILRLYKRGSIPHWKVDSGEAIVNILTRDQDARQKSVGQNSYLISTREGFRYRHQSLLTKSEADGENHRDVFLAAFAELGVPLDFPVETGSRVGNITDLLNVTMVNFQIQQKEI
jgi:hypothetical protein